MKGAVLHAPYDVRFEERPDPKIEQPTDAIMRSRPCCNHDVALSPTRPSGK